MPQYIVRFCKIFIYKCNNTIRILQECVFSLNRKFIKLRLHEEIVHLVSLVYDIIVGGHNIFIMNMITIKLVEMVHIYRKVHKSQVYSSMSYHQVSTLQTISQKEYNQHSEATLKVPPVLSGR